MICYNIYIYIYIYIYSIFIYRKVNTLGDCEPLCKWVTNAMQQESEQTHTHKHTHTHTHTSGSRTRYSSKVNTLPTHHMDDKCDGAGGEASGVQVRQRMRQSTNVNDTPEPSHRQVLFPFASNS